MRPGVPFLAFLVASLDGRFLSNVVALVVGRKFPKDIEGVFNEGNVAALEQVAQSNVVADGRNGTGEETDPDTAAEETFIRKCKVVVAVRDTSNLPVDAVENFCQKTTAVVECRMNLVTKLKDAHEQGGTSLDGFCHAIYAWFQKKYGMFCPQQCNKLQCQSTCAWLKRKKLLEADNTQLKADMQESEAGSAELKEETSKVKQMEEDVRFLNRTADQAAVELSRAKARKTEAEEDLSLQKTRLEASQEKSATQETMLATLDEKLKQNADDLDKVEKTLDMAEVNHTGMVRNLDKLQAKIDTHAEKIDAMEKEALAGDAAKEDLAKALTTEEQKADALSDAVQKQQSVVDTHEEALERAKNKLENATAEKQPVAAIKNFESLVETQQKEADAANNKLADLVHDLSQQNMTIQHAKQEISTYEEDAAQLLNKTSSAKEQLTFMKTQYTALEEQAKSFSKDVIDKGREEASALTAKIFELKDQYKKANITLDFKIKAAKEQQAVVSKAEQSLTEAAQKYGDAQGKFGEAQSELDVKASDLAQANESLGKMQAEFDSAHEDLEFRMNSYKAAFDDLEKDKPDVVKQHGLGFLQALA